MSESQVRCVLMRRRTTGNASTPKSNVSHAYNTCMKNALLTVLTCMMAPLGSAASAQTTVLSDVTASAPASRPDQTIQLIRTEDAGSRIDEVRVGGQTQSITVQPKVGNNLPAYEVKPANTARGVTPSNSSDTTGSRVWNVLKF